MESNNVSMKKSTLWKGAVIILIIVLIFFTFRENLGGGSTGNVVAVGSKGLYADLSFKELCVQTGGMWMKMQPTQNFAPTCQPACLGCMQSGGDHICNKEQYIQALQTQ